MADDAPSPPATRLAQVQQFMQAALVAQDGAPVDAQQLQAHIAPGARLSAAQHLAIYQRGYYARLLQCMQGQFKALSHALGPQLFADFAREYLRQTPSRSPTLALLGQDFVAWLQRNRPDADAPEKEEWIDFMVDLADFEWTLYSLFDAPGAEEQGYATQPPELLNPALRLQPCLRLCRYRYPVSGYYQQVSALEVAAEAADAALIPASTSVSVSAQAGEDPPLPAPQACWLALVRSNYRIGIFTLLPAQYHLLAQLQQAAPGTTVDDALHSTAQTFGKPLDLVERGWAQWREAWGAAGFFARTG